MCPTTFEKLDLILRSMCDSLNGEQGSHYSELVSVGGQTPLSRKDEECIAVSALNLLKLQVDVQLW